MSTTPLDPLIETQETGGLHRYLDTVEAALDYAFAKKQSRHTPNPETWSVVLTTLAHAISSKAPEDLAVAHRKLTDAIGQTLRATGRAHY
ncbi:hypothetical protein N8I74_16880 [Chitiniphilus purpureus]|uniref:Uncharacterized protein n=1 Tax=Chitiniphilus purpureus TaxID=2981137 RepID=A0ABY6DKT8_9NEIS|nr:hypothetical protein [Chitiniphilus sp. CD1]UXY14974.1 hypothetical protein N8I74_16880 [Chitiniphilus sp. CD1]